MLKLRSHRYIPKRLVEMLVEVYEEKELNLLMEDSYKEKKQALLNRRKISHLDFQQFVNSTTDSIYTQFNYFYPVKSFAKRKRMNEIKYDIKLHDILYIAFTSFNDESSAEIGSLLDKYAKMSYLILDLRNNSGGKLDACLKIARQLLPRCNMLILNYKEKQVIYQKINNEFYDFKKIFILVNPHTASCSEILALMLVQKLHNVHLIGEGTVKKTVTLHAVTNLKYRYHFSITDARWYVDHCDVHDLQSNIIPVETEGCMNQILKIIQGDD
ncbi:S41 family peptidase [Paenibacillus sp. FSL L8-0436]|uniref:S41 family peptidase n=1 Tax=Paenibacillus sp. FSL L8-0436 TaxID=2954686 RepID=UPI00315944A4